MWTSELDADACPPHLPPRRCRRRPLAGLSVAVAEAARRGHCPRRQAVGPPTAFARPVGARRRMLLPTPGPRRPPSRSYIDVLRDARPWPARWPAKACSWAPWRQGLDAGVATPDAANGHRCPPSNSTPAPTRPDERARPAPPHRPDPHRHPAPAAVGDGLPQRAPGHQIPSPPAGCCCRLRPAVCCCGRRSLAAARRPAGGIVAGICCAGAAPRRRPPQPAPGPPPGRRHPAPRSPTGRLRRSRRQHPVHQPGGRALLGPASPSSADSPSRPCWANFTADAGSSRRSSSAARQRPAVPAAGPLAWAAVTAARHMLTVTLAPSTATQGGAVLAFHDVTESVASTTRLIHEATHDPSPACPTAACCSTACTGRSPAAPARAAWWRCCSSTSTASSASTTASATTAATSCCRRRPAPAGRGAGRGHRGALGRRRVHRPPRRPRRPPLGGRPSPASSSRCSTRRSTASTCAALPRLQHRHQHRPDDSTDADAPCCRWPTRRCTRADGRRPQLHLLFGRDECLVAGPAEHRERPPRPSPTASSSSSPAPGGPLPGSAWWASSRSSAGAAPASAWSRPTSSSPPPRRAATSAPSASGSSAKPAPSSPAGPPRACRWCRWPSTSRRASAPTWPSSTPSATPSPRAGSTAAAQDRAHRIHRHALSRTSSPSPAARVAELGWHLGG